MHKLTDQDTEDLRKAKALLENPGLVIKLANAIGMPIETLVSKRLPSVASAVVQRATRKSLEIALYIAVRTMKRDHVDLPAKNRLHKTVVGGTGALSGFFGLAALPIELPVTTTAMLRSILDIARSEGESIRDPETCMACLEVLAMGGSSKSDDGAELGYFAVRTALAREFTAAVEHFATKGLSKGSAPVLVKLITRIAAYFAIPVSEKVLAQAVPVLGAVTGTTLNLAFIQHFQNMARGHFIVRRLERACGATQVRAAYDAL